MALDAEAMSAMSFANRALVTGGSGYLASHVVAELLASSDVIVHATVRSLANTQKVAHLQEMQRRYPGRLNLFEADLLKEGSFLEAMSGCSVVYHVASPFMLPEKITDGQRQMVDPAVRGTRNVLNSVDLTLSVRRVVLTSTVGAIFGDYIDVRAMKDGILSERYFNESSTVDNNPYHYAKVMAERTAWEMNRRQSRWDMVSINPGLILGPSLSPSSESGSLFLLDEMLKGWFFYGAPDLSFTVVDVRDVARAHLQATVREGATGRYILADRRMYSFLDIAKVLRTVHRRPYVLPRQPIPDWTVRLLGPLFGLTPDYIRKHLGIRFEVDNTRSVRELGVVYRPLQQTLVDHYESWHAQKAASTA